MIKFNQNWAMRYSSQAKFARKGKIREKAREMQSSDAREEKSAIFGAHLCVVKHAIFEAGRPRFKSNPVFRFLCFTGNYWAPLKSHYESVETDLHNNFNDFAASPLKNLTSLACSGFQ